MIQWVKDRIKESSTKHGIGLLIACLLIIAFGSLAKILAYCGVAYSIWRICKRG